jgi:hypothetical protein
MTKRFNHEGHKGHEECVHESIFVVFVFFAVKEMPAALPALSSRTAAVGGWRDLIRMDNE